MKAAAHKEMEKASKRRLLSVYWLLMIFSLLLFLTFLSFIIFQDMARAEDEFNQYSHQVHQSLTESFTVNETILDGFAAFLANTGMQDPNKARSYTRSMIERYSHLYMFQAAQRVHAKDVPEFERRISRHLDSPLKVRSLDFSQGLQLADVTAQKDYYPIVFVEPTFSDGVNILGLDISSIEFIKDAMEGSLSSGLANLSQPIELSEGNLAFVMIKPSFIPGEVTPRQFALLVVKTEALLPSLRTRLAGYELRVAFRQHEPLLDLSNKKVSDWQSQLFPLLSHEALISLGSQNIKLTITRQLSFSQVNLHLVVIVFLVTLALGVLLHLYMRINFEAEQLRHEADQKLYQQANYDQLTGLANRHNFEDHFSRAVKGCKRRDQKMALLYIDLNNFKVINDTLGHQMGDKILSTAASIIVDVIRADDMACRFGGDEFVVLLENINLATNAKRVIKELHDSFKLVNYLDGKNVHLSASIGCSLYPDEGHNLIELMKCADKKMYEAKSRSKVVKLGNHKKPLA